jgi:ABC-2 type transport system ATP-binding protein
MSDTSRIEVTSLVVDRGGRRVLDGLDLHVAQGEIYALLGGNGSGKSTTLAALLGFVSPRAGHVRVAGYDPAHSADLARRKIAYLPENVAFYEHLTARENIDYFLALAGETPSIVARDAALTAAGLETDARDRRLAQFSKGMRQKVAIALAVVRQVPVLLLDEPTSGLDPRAAADFNALISQLKGQGAALLVVTHDLLGAAACADRIGFLDRGRIVEEVARADGFDVLALHRRYGEAVAA